MGLHPACPGMLSGHGSHQGDDVLQKFKFLLFRFQQVRCCPRIVFFPLACNLAEVTRLDDGADDPQGYVGLEGSV